MGRYREAKWLNPIGQDGLYHFKGGYYESAIEGPKEEDYDVIIPTHYIPELIHYLTEQGYIKPQLSKESREEDLKIIHRLLDIAEKK